MSGPARMSPVSLSVAIEPLGAARMSPISLSAAPAVEPRRRVEQTEAKIEQRLQPIFSSLLLGKCTAGCPTCGRLHNQAV